MEIVLVMKLKIDKMWLNILLLTAIPLLCAVMLCMQQGIKPHEIYIPNSPWNDELIYYKWVEGTSIYGVPQGYFGYNESHADYLNFGTWSPVLNIFWVMFGKIFGWSFLSPIVCNILLMCLAMFLFAFWVRPNRYQTAALAMLFVSYTTISRFMLSVLPEISCYFLLILTLGLTLKRDKKKWVIVLLFVLVYLLTLMRPYYILLFFLPGYFFVISGKKKTIPVLITMCMFCLGGGTYIWVNRHLCAPYFLELFNTGWLRLLFADFGDGVFNILHILLNSGKVFLQYAGNGITGDGDPAGFVSQGGWCLVYLLLMIWMAVRFYDAYKKKDKGAVLYAYGFVLFLAVMIAVFLFFDVFNGSKHFVEFTVAGIFAFAMQEAMNKRTVLLTILFVYLFTAKAASAYEWSVPAWTVEMGQEMEHGKNQLKSTIDIDAKADRWDNTVIWDLSSKWQDAYAFPAGAGINLCQTDYILNNFHQLKSKYLMTAIDGQVDIFCKENQKELLAEFGQVRVYKMR